MEEKRNYKKENCEEEVCENCGYSESHMNLYDKSIPSKCKHRNKNGNYDCDCEKFEPTQFKGGKN